MVTNQQSLEGETKLDVMTDKSAIGQSKSDSVSGVGQFASGIVTYLTWFFTLTEEERLQAGIHLRKNYHNESKPEK